MDALVEKIEALAARVERDGVPVPSLDLCTTRRPLLSASRAIFCEFDQLAIPLDVEAALLRSDDARRVPLDDRKSSLFRQEAYEALEEPLLGARALDATLDPDFVAFCEAASVAARRCT